MMVKKSKSGEKESIAEATTHVQILIAYITPYWKITAAEKYIKSDKRSDHSARQV